MHVRCMCKWYIYLMLASVLLLVTLELMILFMPMCACVRENVCMYQHVAFVLIFV